MKRPFVQKEPLKIVISQLALVFILLPFIWIGCEARAAGSFLLGGLISVLPTAYFYFRVFSHFGARAARETVSAFYRGEAVKILMSAVGFGVAFSIAWVLPLWVFTGYAMAQLGFWIAGMKAR